MSKKHKMSEISIHHRLSKKNGGTNDDSNCSEVSPLHHNSYNNVFNDGHYHPIRIASILTNIWIRPDWVMIAVPRCTECKNCTPCRLEAQNGHAFMEAK